MTISAIGPLPGIDVPGMSMPITDDLSLDTNGDMSGGVITGNNTADGSLATEQAIREQIAAFDTSPTADGSSLGRAPNGCDASARPRGFRSYSPSHSVLDRKGKYFSEWVIQLFKQSHANDYVNVGFIKQFTECAAGGAQSRGGNYLDRSAVFMAARDKDYTLHNWNWGSGSSNGQVSASVTVNATGGPFTIGATVPVTTQDTFGGSEGVVDKDSMGAFSPYAANEVNGYWESGTHFYEGSPHFEGNTAQAVWEYPQRARNPSIGFVTFVRVHCHHLFGADCE